jgi:hypothetical protein
MKEYYKASCEKIAKQGHCQGVPCTDCPFAGGHGCNDRGFCGVEDIALYDEKLVRFAKLWLELNND